jgi:hypothetical protein
MTQEKKFKNSVEDEQVLRKIWHTYHRTSQQCAEFSRINCKENVHRPVHVVHFCKYSAWACSDIVSLH